MYRPAAVPTPALEALKAFNLKVGKVDKSVGQTRVVAMVTADSSTYSADYQAKSFGYQLKLSLVSAVPAPETQPRSFDAAALATFFLNRHQLTGEPSTAQCTAATPQPDGSIVVTCTENQQFLVTGAHATFTFDASGMLTSLDILWVDTSSAASAFQAIPFVQAAHALQKGNALITPSGAFVAPDTVISSVTVVYVPLNGIDGTYYEPVYELSGQTQSGSPFQIYVPALDSSLYSSGS